MIFNFGCTWESPGRPKKYWYVGSTRPTELLGMEPRLLHSGESDVDCELNTPASDSRPLKGKNHPFLIYTEYIQYLAQCLAHSISKLFIEFHWINDTHIFQLLTCSSIHSLRRQFLPFCLSSCELFPLIWNSCFFFLLVHADSFFRTLLDQHLLQELLPALRGEAFSTYVPLQLVLTSPTAFTTSSGDVSASYPHLSVNSLGFWITFHFFELLIFLYI